jgi:hypothetical protein
MALQLDIRIEIVYAGDAVKRPGVPRANDLAAVDIAIAERTASVGTETVETAQDTIVITEGVGGIVELNLRE